MRKVVRGTAEGNLVVEYVPENAADMARLPTMVMEGEIPLQDTESLTKEPVQKEISNNPVFVLNTEENDDWIRQLPGYKNEVQIIDEAQREHDKNHKI